MKIPDRVLIVDCSALCYSAYFSMPKLSSRNAETNIIYGFFLQLQTVCRFLRVGHIVFCWDSRKSYRKCVFSGYKSNREQKSPELLSAFSQFDSLRREILPRLNFVNSFQRNGFEADDLIASVCRFPGPKEGQKYFILSGDQDLYQLLTHSVSMIKNKKNNRYEIYSKQDFMEEYKIDPLLWAGVKCMAGCTSDTVPGIPGIGIKRAIEYIHDFRDYSRPHKKIDTPEGRAIMERNKPLVVLPYVGTPQFMLDWKTYPDYAAWMDFCGEYEFESFLQKSATWESIFSLEPPAGDGTDRIRMGGKRVKGEVSL